MTEFQAISPVTPSESPTKEKLRVYFPVESLAGLGHFNRVGLLVEAMHAAGMEVTVASGTFVDEERFFPNARRIALPAYVHRNNTGKYTIWDEAGQKKLVTNFDMMKWKNDRMLAHRHIVREFKPHIIVVEFWPFSRRNLTYEITAIRDEALKQRIRPMLVSSVRDVVKGDVDKLRGNEVGRQAKSDGSAVKKLTQVDAVIIHGDERLVGLDKSFTGLQHITDKTYYSGYVVTDVPKRDESIPDKARSVVVHVGSGSGGTDFLMAAAHAWNYVTPEIKGRTWHFITGPRFPTEGWENLANILLSQGKTHISDQRDAHVFQNRNDELRPIFVLDKYRPDLVKLIVDSAVSVSYAGYNTTQEVLSSGVHALLVPKFKRRGEGDVWFDSEQAHRLDVLNEAQLAHTLSAKDAVNPEKLAASIDLAYNTLPTNKNPIDFDGARRTAELLGKLYQLHHHKPTRPKQNAKISLESASKPILVQEKNGNPTRKKAKGQRRSIIVRIEI